MPNSRTTTAPPTSSHTVPATLAASKSAGIAFIRVSQANGDMTVEELNAKQLRIIGFLLHPTTIGKKVTGVAVTQMGSGAEPLPLTSAQRVAMGRITNELKKINIPAGNQTATPPGALQPRETDSDEWWDVLVAVVSCGAAIIEDGLNPIADGECIAHTVKANVGFYQMDDSGGDGNGSESGGGDSDGGDSDGGDGGGGDGSGGGGGGGDDNNDTGDDTKHQDN